MPQLVLGVGSNVEREKNIQLGVAALHRIFDQIICSSIYETNAAGFDGDPFYNLVVVAQTTMDLFSANRCLKDLEVTFGRDASVTKNSPKTLDVDILTFENLVGNFDGIDLPRPEITESSYVLFPLAELCPKWFHPALGETYFEIAKNFKGAKHNIKKIELTLPCRSDFM